ncbi:MAG: MBL fold metallo-hydrolase, partial [Fibrobacterota bacterium]
MRIKFWGTRGSVPVPGPKTVKYGGNTPCTEFSLDDGSRLIIDAGTGIINLGRELMAGEFKEGKGRLVILISHTHWDHIQGVPFFAPQFVEGNQITYMGKSSKDKSVLEILEGQLRAPYSPIYSLENLFADIRCESLPEGSFKSGSFHVTPFSVSHPSPANGFIIEAEGKKAVYCSDAEHCKGALDEVVLNAADGADLLIHDAQFTAKEYNYRNGWGHSSWDTAVRVARV